MNIKIIFAQLLLTLIIVAASDHSQLFASEQNKPNIVILATGGTIAGASNSTTKSSYTAGQTMINTIIEAVPELKNIANIRGEQFVNIGSQDMNEAIWINLAKRVNELIADPTVDGIVITHGTDTMEETAFFLSLTLNRGKAVVLTGSMRPPKHLSADGVINLYEAVLVAADSSSKSYGVTVVMNDEIFIAADVTKTHTRAVDTFKSPEHGPVGFINGDIVKYSLSPMHNLKQVFNIDDISYLPLVGIIYGYAGTAEAAAEGFVNCGYKGLVYAGVGNGNMPGTMIEYLSALTKRGIKIVRASRVQNGGVLPLGEVDDAKYGFIPSGNLSPQKARILLMLSLATGREYMY